MENNPYKRLPVALILVWMLGANSALAARISIAAVVGDDVITTSDVLQRRDLIMATAGIPATIENQQKLTARIIQSLIDETLQLQEAKRNSLAVSDEDLAKALDAMSNNGDNIRDFVRNRGLSQRSLENQLRAQLLWGKVVQRKLRRNVSIAQDEVLRAQKSQAASPGEQELRISALELPIAAATTTEEAAALAEEIMLQLKAGADMATIATRPVRQGEVQFKPPVWVAEKSLPPALAQALRSVAAGDFTPPLRSASMIQILQVLERKTAPRQDESTEYAIKQITIPAPPKHDKLSLRKWRAAANILRANPGSCEDASIPESSLPAESIMVRARLGAMSRDQRAIVGHLDVGEVSEPLVSPEALRLVVLCEKIEPSSGNLPDAEKIRQELFSEKLELEAQKHLRNLRRDAFIDIKGAQ